MDINYNKYNLYQLAPKIAVSAPIYHSNLV